MDNLLTFTILLVISVLIIAFLNANLSHLANLKLFLNDFVTHCFRFFIPFKASFKSLVLWSLFMAP